MQNKCLIWGTPTRSFTDSDEAGITVDSPRAGGKYMCKQEDMRICWSEIKEKAGLARLTSILVDRRKQGIEIPELTLDDIRIASSGHDMRVADRCDRILQYLGAQTILPSHAVELDPHIEGHGPLIFTFHELLAHAECVDWFGLESLLDFLEESRYVKKYGGGKQIQYYLTVPGFERLEAINAKEPDSERAFVAMWFDESMDEPYSKGIMPAVKDAGYKPIRIADEHYTGPIVDRVLSEIRRSRFIVVDYTHEKDNARGSVYFEAGFAQGLGLQVISTCRHDCVDYVHFDAKQFNHIVWKETADLREQLQARITALFGDGPLIGR